MKENILIGLIQPVLNPNISWGKKEPYSLNVDKITSERVWSEIKNGISLLLKEDKKPDIILIPELHLPVDKIKKIEDISLKQNILIIAGVDFQLNPFFKNKIRNRGIITIPNNWGHKLKSNRVQKLFYGKTYFTYMEREMFPKLNIGNCVEDPEQNMYIFKSSIHGNFGIMICSDIFDIERIMLYQGRIQHLFIISLNKDLNTYFSLAESLTRILYCNVVVCNTGFYGGSMVVSPLDDSNDRLIYKYQGQKMFNTHMVSIPLTKLIEAQQFDYSKGNKKEAKIEFKASPPGYNFIP